MTQEPKIFPYIARLLQGAEVVWKPLGEIASMYGGLTGKNKTDFEGGNASYITYKNIFDNIEVDFDKLEKVKISASEKQNKVRYGDVLFTGSSETAEDAGMSSAITTTIEEDIYLNSFSFGVRFNEDVELIPEFSKYLFRSYFMRAAISKTASGVTRFNISKERLKKLPIPLPPLSVQQEIVRILDKFTQLEAELEAELDCRKRQYEYYRNKLLTFSEIGGGTEIVWKTLGEVGEVTKLAGFEFTNYVKYNDTGKIIALRGLNVKGSLDLSDVKYIDESDFSKLNRSKLYINDMLFTYVGTVGSVALIPENDKYYLAPNVARIRFLDRKINPRFMFHYFQSDEFKKKQINRYLGSSSMKNLTMENIRKFQIPLPPLEEQQRIATILDKFDTLVNSISEGLPKEIALRRKQYEYYREKLLSFPS